MEKYTNWSYFIGVKRFLCEHMYEYTLKTFT